jgi:hypothetical protein
MLKTEIKGQLFRGRSLSDGFKGVSLTECTFHSCRIRLPLVDPAAPFHKQQYDLGRRPVIRDMELRRCRILASVGCTLKGAIVEDVLVEDLRTDGMVQTWATVFKHVTFKGKIGRVMFSELFTPCDPPTSKFQQAIAKANAEYYATVDWALDIREAEFDDFDCRGVPSRLVRRNPETQMMLTRQRVLEHRDSMGAGGEYWERLVKLFLQRADGYGGPMEDAICIVPRQGVDRKALIAGIEVLRKAGVAEPD